MKLFLSLALALLVSAPQRPATFALSADEQREAVAAKTAVEQSDAARVEAYRLSLSTNVRDPQATTAASCTIQIVELRAQLAEAKDSALLWRLRAKYSCAECEFDAGRTKLVRGK